MGQSKIKYLVASDVSSRDGIGLEAWLDDELILEIFREDEKKERQLTIYKKDVPLDLVEAAITMFKKEIPWDFME
jgi:hypothetical protein